MSGDTVVSSVGVKLYISDGSNIGTEIAKITSLSLGAVNVDIIEITKLNSTTGYKSYIASLIDSGDLQFQLFFTSNGYDLLYAEIGETTEFKVVFPDERQTSFTFEGIVKSLGTQAKVGAVLTVDCTIKITDIITIGAEA